MKDEEETKRNKVGPRARGALALGSGTDLKAFFLAAALYTTHVNLTNIIIIYIMQVQARI